MATFPVWSSARRLRYYPKFAAARFRRDLLRARVQGARENFFRVTIIFRRVPRDLFRRDGELVRLHEVPRELLFSVRRLCTRDPCSLILFQRNLFPVTRFIEYRGSSDADSVRSTIARHRAKSLSSVCWANFNTNWLTANGPMLRGLNKMTPGCDPGGNFRRSAKSRSKVNTIRPSVLAAAPSSTSSFPRSPSSSE